MDIVLPIFGRDSVLNVELLLLSTKVVALRAQGKILRAIEVESLLPGILHGQVVATDLDLIKLVWVDKHFSLRLSQKALHILSLELAAEVLILRGDRLLGAKALHSGGQS